MGGDGVEEFWDFVSFGFSLSSEAKDD